MVVGTGVGFGDGVVVADCVGLGVPDGLGVAIGDGVLVGVGHTAPGAAREVALAAGTSPGCDRRADCAAAFVTQCCGCVVACGPSDRDGTGAVVCAGLTPWLVRLPVTDAVPPLPLPVAEALLVASTEEPNWAIVCRTGVSVIAIAAMDVMSPIANAGRSQVTPPGSGDAACRPAGSCGRADRCRAESLPCAR